MSILRKAVLGSFIIAPLWIASAEALDLLYNFEGDSGDFAIDKLTGDGAQNGELLGNVTTMPGEFITSTYRTVVRQGALFLLLEDLAGAALRGGRTLQLDDQVAINAAKSGNTIQIKATARAATPMQVHLVGLNASETVKIKRGENAGRSINYHNTVRDWVTLQDWDGRAPLSIRHEVPEGEQTVVIVQKAGHGPILGAVKVR